MRLEIFYFILQIEEVNQKVQNKLLIVVDINENPSSSVQRLSPFLDFLL